MKRILFSLIVFLTATGIFAQEPLMKVYLGDGSNKTYNINEIEEMSFISVSNNFFMKLYFDKTKDSVYPVSTISKMGFGFDSFNRRVLNLHTANNIKQFTLSSIDSIIFYDIEKVFDTINICEQIWMKQNLNVSHYRNGDTIREVKTNEEWEEAKKNEEGAWCYYNNDPKNGEIYGKLYNWFAVNDPRGLAPEGWHVPSDEEWKELEICLGMSRSEADKDGWRGIDQGSQLAGGADLWKDGALKSNSKFGKSGFSALPSGRRISWNGEFDTIIGIHRAFWWSATEDDEQYLACFRNLDFGDAKVYRNYYNKGEGLSVRCVRDFKNVFNPNITSVSPNPAVIENILTITGTNFGVEQRSSYVNFTSENIMGINASDYISWSVTEIKVTVPTGAKSGKLFVKVGEKISNEIEIKIVETYDTIKICKQTWMKHNLNVSHYRNGDTIRHAKTDEEWEEAGKNEEGAWCYYNNDPKNGEIYGKLYNWYAVNDPRGLAPAGWHVSTDAEWTELVNCLGGEDVAGGKLKEIGTSPWYSPNTGATNESRFSAFPGGWRVGDGTFSGLGFYGEFWSSTESIAACAWGRGLNYQGTDIYRYSGGVESGFSVRCVKD